VNHPYEGWTTLPKYEGWIGKGWAKDGPPFLRVDNVRVDQRRVVKGWITFLKGG